MKRVSGGFTLIELIFTVSVVAILLSVALPAYQDQIRASRRAEGKAALMQAAHMQERNYTQSSTYADTAALAALLGASGTIYSGEDPNSVKGRYTISVDAATAACPLARCFVVRAAPNAGQFSDPQCGELTLSSTGAKGVGGGATFPVDRCW